MVFHANQVDSLLRHWWRWGDCLAWSRCGRTTASRTSPTSSCYRTGCGVDDTRTVSCRSGRSPALCLSTPRAWGASTGGVQGIHLILHPSLTGPAVTDAPLGAASNSWSTRSSIWAQRPTPQGCGGPTTATWIGVAVRPPIGTYTDKLAPKLYMVWRAGVPALLGLEPAFRELYTDPLRLRGGDHGRGRARWAHRPSARRARSLPAHDRARGRQRPWSSRPRSCSSDGWTRCGASYGRSRPSAVSLFPALDPPCAAQSRADDRRATFQ